MGPGIVEDYNNDGQHTTWLADFKLPMLSNIHDDFYSKGVSSMDSSNDLNIGRRHGGMAILWRK